MSEPSRSLFENAAGTPGRMSAFASGKLQDKDNHFKTLGEKKFDRRVYYSVGYVLNALLSLVAVWAVERTSKGHELVNRLTRGIVSTTNADPNVARYLANRTFLLTGGFAVLLPMKWLEDRKLQTVKKWNRKIYGEQAETDPQIRQSEQELAHARKQTWGSIFGSRILALIPFYIMIGLLWNRISMLSQWTNPRLRAIGTDAVAAQRDQWSGLGAIKGYFARKHIKAEAFVAAEQADPIGFSQLASRGIYFDRPITWAARWIGRGVTAITGNQPAEARIRDFQLSNPSHILNDVAGSPRDPAHSALPYYVATEAILSYTVAWGVYRLTRILGPLIGQKVEAPEKSAPQAEPEIRTQAEEVQVQPKVEERPATRVDIAGIEHKASAKRENVSAR